MPLPLEHLNVSGQTTLKETVIGSTSSDSKTNIVEKVNSIIDLAGTGGGGGGGISSITSPDQSINVTDPTGPDVKITVSGGGGGGWDPNKIEWLGKNESVSQITQDKLVNAAGEVDWAWCCWAINAPTNSPLLIFYTCCGGSSEEYHSNLGWTTGYASETMYNIIVSSTLEGHRYFFYAGIWGNNEFYQPKVNVDGIMVNDGNLHAAVPHPQENYDIYIPDKKLFTVKQNSNLTPKDLKWSYYVNAYRLNADGKTHRYDKKDIADFEIENWSTSKKGVNYYTLKYNGMWHKIPYVVE